MCEHNKEDGRYFENCEDCMDTLMNEYDQGEIINVKDLLSWNEFIEKCKEKDLVVGIKNC